MNDSGRRTFLKKGLMAGSVMLAPGTLLNMTSAQSIAQKEKVRIGVVGPGSRGAHLIGLINSVREKENIEVVAICDIYEPSIQHALSLVPNARVFRDYRSMLEMKDLHAIVVATPLYEHAKATVDALNNGIHVFCEKAMALTLDDTYAMAEAHYRTGNILHIGHQRLFDPKFLMGMSRIHNGDLGLVTQIRAYWHRNNNWRRAIPANQPELERFINWRLYREYSLGLMTELACHHIQVANWAKKALPVAVRGAGSISYWKDGREVEDNIALIYSYADGTQFIYDSMIQNKKYGLEVQVMGDKGAIELETNRLFVEEPPAPPKPAGIVQLIQDINEGVFGAVSIGSSSWDAELASTYKGEPLIAENNTDGTLEQLIAFADSVRDGKPVPGLFEQCYYGSLWTLLGQEAIDTGKVITMPEKLSLF